MNILPVRIGYLMSVISLIMFVLYVGCFSAILFFNEPFVWTDISALAAYEANSILIFKYLGMATMMFYSCCFVVMLSCLKDQIDSKLHILLDIAKLFAIAFCITISINYFVQITATRMQLAQEITEGLTQFTQSFNISALNAVNMLGWTLFYGIATLALFFLFKKAKIQKMTKWFCLGNSIMMFVGLSGYILNSYPILLVTMNIGLGFTSLGLVLSLFIYFKSKLKAAV